MNRGGLGSAGRVRLRGGVRPPENALPPPKDAAS